MDILRILKTEQAESSEVVPAAWDHFAIGTQNACSWKIACFWPVLGPGETGRERRSGHGRATFPSYHLQQLPPQSWIQGVGSISLPLQNVLFSVFSAAQKRGTLWVPIPSLWGASREGQRSDMWKELGVPREWVQQHEVWEEESKAKKKGTGWRECKIKKTRGIEKHVEKAWVKNCWERLRSRAEKGRKNHRWLLKTDQFSFKNCQFLLVIDGSVTKPGGGPWQVSQLNHWDQCQCGGPAGNSSSFDFHFPWQFAVHKAAEMLAPGSCNSQAYRVQSSQQRSWAVARPAKITLFPRKRNLVTLVQSFLILCLTGNDQSLDFLTRSSSKQRFLSSFFSLWGEEVIFVGVSQRKNYRGQACGIVDLHEIQ